MYNLHVTRDYEEDDRKRRRGDRSSYSGPTSSFTEKRGYKPEVGRTNPILLTCDYILKTYFIFNRSDFLQLSETWYNLYVTISTIVISVLVLRFKFRKLFDVLKIGYICKIATKTKYLCEGVKLNVRFVIGQIFILLNQSEAIRVYRWTQVKNRA